MEAVGPSLLLIVVARHAWQHQSMPETSFFIPDMRGQADADAVMFELQDLPCVHQADVDLGMQTAWVSHSNMIAAEDIAAKLQDAGYESRVVDPAAG